MANRSVSPVVIQQFRREVKHNYQGKARLGHAVYPKRSVEGDTVWFNKMGVVRMMPRLYRTTIVPNSGEYSRVKCELSPWMLAQLTDSMEETETNVNDRAELAKNLGMAMGRQEDQYCINSLTTSTPGTSIAAGASTGFVPTPTEVTNKRPSKLIGACMSALLDKECPENGEYFALLPAIWYDDFAADPSVASRDFGESNVTRSGLSRRLMLHGVELIFMGNRQTSATDVDNVANGGWNSAGGEGYVWEKNALGLAYGVNPTVSVDWIPMEDSWLTKVKMRLGSVAIDTDGIVKITGGPTS